MVENKFFLDSDNKGVTGELLFPLSGGKQVQVRGIPPPKKNYHPKNIPGKLTTNAIVQI